MRTPSCGHLTIYFSPQVTLVHLAADPIPLGLRVTGQKVPQKLVRPGNSLLVSLHGFFDYLLGLNELQLAGLLVFLGTCTLGPIWEPCVHQDWPNDASYVDMQTQLQGKKTDKGGQYVLLLDSNVAIHLCMDTASQIL
jgi:hypothetical protein